MKAALAAMLVLAAACSFGAAPLPTANADIGASHLSLARGSYCWSSGGQATCADSADPDTLLRTGYLKPVTAPASARARITFSSQPSRIAVALGQEPVGSDASFTLPSQSGRYVYTITGFFPEGDVGFFLPVDVTR